MTILGGSTVCKAEKSLGRELGKIGANGGLVIASRGRVAILLTALIGEG